MTESTPNPLLKQHFGKTDFSALLSVVSSQNPSEIKEVILSIEKLIKATTEGSTKLTYNQVRNIYDIVKNEEFKTNILGLILILPKLAYIESRQTGEGRKLANFIRELATAVNTTDEYKIFIDLMTALVAYHKLHVKS